MKNALRSVSALILFCGIYTNLFGMKKTSLLRRNSKKFINCHRIVPFLAQNNRFEKDSCLFNFAFRQNAIKRIFVQDLEDEIRRGASPYASVVRFAASFYVTQKDIDRLFGAAVAYKNKKIVKVLTPKVNFSNQDVVDIIIAANNTELLQYVNQLSNKKIVNLNQKLHGMVL